MNASLVLILIIVILGLFLNNKKSPKTRIIYIIICCTVFLLSSSLRSIYDGVSLGWDTVRYQAGFQNMGDNTFDDIIEMFIDRYFYRDNENDIGFYFLQRTIRLFTSSFHVFTFIAQLLFFVPFGLLLYRKCQKISHLIFAFSFYLALVHVQAYTGARQFYALGLGLMSFLCFERNKIKTAVLLLLIGMTIHLSLLITILPFVLLIFFCKYLKKIHLLTLMSAPLVLAFPNQLVMFLGNAIDSEKYANYGAYDAAGGAITFILMLELMSLFCYIVIKWKFLVGNPSLLTIYSMLPCISFFGPLVYADGVMIRVSMYFFIYLSVLIPLGTEYFHPKSMGTLVLFILTTSLILLTVSSGDNTDYHFFWEVDNVDTW